MAIFFRMKLGYIWLFFIIKLAESGTPAARVQHELALTSLKATPSVLRSRYSAQLGGTVTYVEDAGCVWVTGYVVVISSVVYHCFILIAPSNIEIAVDKSSSQNLFNNFFTPPCNYTNAHCRTSISKNTRYMFTTYTFDDEYKECKSSSQCTQLLKGCNDPKED